MPNTLAHIAIQTVLTGSLTRSAGYFSLALLGSVIPDIPWILQRLIALGPFDIDPYALRAYATVQASLFVSLMAAAAVARLFVHSLQAFLIVSAGCLLHLLLDASEIKWGNGVNLLAPFTWSQANWGIVWPEHAVVGITSLCGIAVFAYCAKKSLTAPPGLTAGRPRIITAAMLAAVYLFLPFAFIQEPFRANSHYLATLSDISKRTGKTVQLDRATVLAVDQNWYARSYAGGSIQLTSFEPLAGGTYSLKGTFVSEHRIAVTQWHRHDGLRDIASIIGLSLMTVWLLLVAYQQRNILRSSGTKGTR